MTRQRSQSASSAQQLTAAKSPRSPTASLATAAALYDPQQLPKTLQDILLLAQSHYISHRYVQALSFYKLAAEHHHSLPACSSLYALYTSNQTGSGLVRSDTKAALILIHALRIWTARRWSTSARIEPTGSMRSRTQDDHDELEEYFAHPRKPTRQQSGQHKQQLRRSLSTGATASFRPTREQLLADPGNKNALAQSMESEYRHPQFLNWRDEAVAEIHNESRGSEGESESSEDDDDSDDECEGDQADLNTDQEVSDHDDDGDDEGQEKEEEARRIGLATSEIEDIIQKICHMIQKGVLGLDEPVLVEAVSMLRKIERNLHQEANAIKAERARSVSLFTSSLSRGSSDEAVSLPALLLTQGVDLSFLDLGSPDDDGSDHLTQAQTQPMGRSIRQRPGRNFTSPIPLTHGSSLVSPPLSKHSPMNASIAKLSTKEQETDHLFACAIRIRVMFTLGWVHQQKGEYHYGAQAYGVCSEIPATGKRLLDSLQHQANVQRWTCKAFEHKAQEQAEAAKRRAVEAEDEEDSASHLAVAPTGAATPTPIEGKKKKNTSATRSPPSRNTIGSSASSLFTSSQPSTGGSRRHHRPDISSPSSLSGSESESASTSIHGRSSSASAVSSFSAAIWSSGLFRSNSKTSTSSLPSKVSAGLKLQTVLDPPVTIETKDRRHRGRTSKSEGNKHQHQKHQHKQQQQRQAGTGVGSLPTLVMTMTGHQNQIVKCGHCGLRRALMPLLVVSPSSALGIVDNNFSVEPMGVAL
ncbi:hypothetical protein KI688_010444 [Linnemannia hyalina]|uniref:Uncharacterized protein n=1 Tax=Linnemannia hyalina TaxID=64524 RepID=A0A9P7Y1E4_9FUNG|nr:hypothetical protein KI688_010444 [Linnemannia hyalina]